MTTGVCIMNKRGVALAADSAGTIGDHIMVRNSEEKVFQLSQGNPVAIAVCDNLNFMGMPIDIIIDKYTAQARCFPHLKDYVDDFFSFIIENQKFFRFDEFLDVEVEDVTCDFIDALFAKIDEQGGMEMFGGNVSNNLFDYLQKTLENTNVGKVTLFSDEDKEYLTNKYEEKVYDILSREIPELTNAKLFKAASLMLETVLLDIGSLRTGICIAGYGSEDIFPSCVEVNISMLLRNRILMEKTYDESISHKIKSILHPFAQIDVIDTFIGGIDFERGCLLQEEIVKEISCSVQEVLFGKEDKYKFSEVPSARKKTLVKDIEKIVNDNFNLYHDRMYDGNSATFYDSIITMNVKDLAFLADSLVGITSLRRNTEADKNMNATVGGPVDVAMITKAEGLVWYKHK